MSTPESNLPGPPGEVAGEATESSVTSNSFASATSAASATSPGATPDEVALPEDLRTPWNWLDLLFFLLFSLGSSIVLTWVVALAALVWYGVTPWDVNQSAGIKAIILILSQGLWSAVTLLYLFVAVRLRHAGPFWHTIGWRHLRPRTMTRQAAALMCLLGGVGLAMVIQVSSALIGKKARLPIEELFQNRQSVLLLMALGILVAPLVEETVFRGYIYPVVARRFGIPTGVLATGALFGMAHAVQLWGGWGQIGLLVVVGVVLTYVRARTGTVLASYFFHLGYNCILFLGFYFATGGLRHFPSAS